jgi:CheY-like chemotaxis protein
MGQSPVAEPSEPTSWRPAQDYVLVLDDDWDICEAVKDVLQDAGIDSVCRTDGAQGLEYLLACPRLPSLILLDLMMPKVDGWTFFEMMRAHPRLRDIPVIVLTAAGPYRAYPRAPLLRKPIDGHALVAVVREALRGGSQSADPAVSAPAEPPARPTLPALGLRSVRLEILAALGDPHLNARTIQALRTVLRLLDAALESEDRSA